MDNNYFIEMLIRNREIFVNFLAGVSQEAFLWKPEPGKWCLLEVLCHLIDEEKEDFRSKLKKILKNPDSPFVPIDPEKWLIERNYMAQNGGKKLREFLHERDKSVSWLQSLSSPNWGNTAILPSVGPISAEKILANWVAHDYLHIRQITRLRYLYLQDCTGIDFSYSGKW